MSLDEYKLYRNRKLLPQVWATQLYRDARPLYTGKKMIY